MKGFAAVWTRIPRTLLPAAALLIPWPSLGAQELTQEELFPEGGIPVENEQVVDSCIRCHDQHEDGRMSRISYVRKSPEGWETTIRRMVTLNNVRLEPEEARAVVRYLADNHGIAPEELRPGRFEAERRIFDHRYEADADTEDLCVRCHSMGRIITQRRTSAEWNLLLAMHRGYYPLSDFQGFRRMGPPDPDATDTRHPMEKAAAHLSQAFPLETPEWTAWSATMRPPQLAGTWALRGHDPGKGPIYGSVEISAGDDPATFTTRTRYVYPKTGESVEREGRSLVYTGYQWRGRSTSGGDDETTLREVMLVERGWTEMTGRWYRGAYDEFGPDVTLTKIDGPVVLGVHPNAVRVGSSSEVRILTAGLSSDVTAGDLDLGPGVRVTGVRSAGDDGLVASVAVDGDAQVGARDVYVAGRSSAAPLTVYDEVHRIEVTPEAGMARLGGGGAFPKGYAQFEATAFHNGPDGKPETDDDVEIGPVDVEWSLEEYSAVFGDDDIEYAGTLDQNGLFTPALDGPNPERGGERNNVGDLWVVATHQASDGTSVRGRAHLLVTVPLYLRWESGRMTG